MKNVNMYMYIMYINNNYYYVYNSSNTVKWSSSINVIFYHKNVHYDKSFFSW